MGIKIVGSGLYVPTSKLSNKQLESIVETTDEWISTLKEVADLGP